MSAERVILHLRCVVVKPTHFGFHMAGIVRELQTLGLFVAVATAIGVMVSIACKWRL